VYFAVYFATSGADRTRTGDLLVANQLLYQLSYSPYETTGYAAQIGYLSDDRVPACRSWSAAVGPEAVAIAHA
jgi:hypothetical protein